LNETTACGLLFLTCHVFTQFCIPTKYQQVWKIGIRHRFRKEQNAGFQAVD